MPEQESRLAAVGDLTDPLAMQLHAARRSATVLNIADRGLPITRAAVIARQLYAALLSDGAHQIGWKLGATDAGAQGRMGASGPFVAPMFDTGLVQSGGMVRASRYAQPRIEVEVGISVTAAGILVAPCMEIVDCHYAGWRVSIGEAIADFGLHGGVVLGDARALPADINEIAVTLSHDGTIVARGNALLSRLIESSVRLATGPDGDKVVASGRITDLVPIAPGEWVADVQSVGRVTVMVGV